MIRQLLVLAIPATLALPASAQVSVDMHALDQVRGQQPQGQPAGQTPAPGQNPQTTTGYTSSHQARRPLHHPRPEAHAAHPAAKPAQTTAKPEPTTAQPPAASAGNAPVATLPTGPPPEVRLAPLTPAPPIQAQPEAPPPTSREAGTDVLSVSDGLRITFVPGNSDITPDTEDLLHRFARTVPNVPGTTIDVRSYASGSPEDVSSSRRMSLSRSLAVRAALMAGGVPSTHIFVRAFGPNAGDGPADRVDILLNRQTQDNPQPVGTPAPPAEAAAAHTATP